VLNADDFGLSRDTLATTIECFERGLLTSATIMPTASHVDDAVAFARSRPEFSFGAHLTFVGDGEERPAADPAVVPDLVDERGRLRSTTAVRIGALIGRLSVAQIEREVEAQLTVLAERGVAVSHVDSHRHLHKFRPFREALRRVLPRFGIERVRRVQDVYLRPPVSSPTYWLGRRWNLALADRFTTTDHFYMPASAGDVDWEQVAVRMHDFPPSSSIEIGVHPGHDEDWRRAERDALERFVAAAHEDGHALVTWRDVRSREIVISG
jgi:predicted glycoside hydrolase/deacetylase ChbG (UPF0249 family)